LHKIYIYNTEGKFGTCEQYSSIILYPVISLAHTISSYCEKLFSSSQIEDSKTINQEYKKLKEEYEILLLEYIKLSALINYDQLNKDLREFCERYSLQDNLLAKILVKHISQDEHYFIVNRGQRDGVKPNMIAIYKLYLVGKVTQVYPYYSKVLLITDQNSNVSAYTAISHAPGIVKGTNNKTLTCAMSYVSHLLSIEDNDLVISSGEGLIFPEGFCLGKIIKHTLPEKSLYHEITIAPCVNLSQITFCLLIDRAKIKIF
jgi:rod shape-determining protein MreC